MAKTLLGTECRGCVTDMKVIAERLMPSRDTAMGMAALIEPQTNSMRVAATPPTRDLS